MQQTELKAVVQEFPAKVGLDLANWNWKVVRRFVQERFEVSLSRSSCLNYLHRLGFVLKRPKKRLLKADAAQRETFVAEYAALVDEAQQVGAKVFFVDEAHFRADADLRGKWVLKGEPALVDSTSPRWAEKASYYSAVCLETGEVELGTPGGDRQPVCLGAKSAVQEKVNNFFTQLAGRQPEVKQRCRTVLQTRAEGLLGKAHADPRRPTNVDPTLALV